MSVELVVDLVRPVTVGQVAAVAHPVVRKLLGLSKLPDLLTNELQAGVRLPADGSRVVDNHTGWTLRLSDYSACAFFGATEVDDESSTPRRRLLAWSVASASRTPLEYALVAGVAFAFAKIQGRRIIDDSRFYTRDIDIDADSFLERTQVHGEFEDIDAAAQSFFDGLFRGGLPARTAHDANT